MQGWMRDSLVIGTVLLVCPGVPAAAEDAPAAVQLQPAQPAPASSDQAAEHDTAEQDKPRDLGEMSPQELRERMDELEKQMTETRNAFRQAAQEDAPDPQQMAETDVEKIKLPENPTRADYEQYVADIEALSNNLRTISSNSPIVDKLKEIPVEHVDLVLGMLGKGNIAGYFAQYALNGYDWAGARETITAKLGEQPALIAIVLQMGWVQDVRDQVLQRVENADGALPLGWYQAAVELREPAIYPHLHEIAAHSTNAAAMISMLETLEGFDANRTAAEAWEHAGRPDNNGSNKSSLAPLMARQGNVEALGILVGQLRQEPNQMRFSIGYRQDPQETQNASRTQVLRLLDFTASNDELVQWYQENKDKLIYDYVRERFVLPEAF